MCSNSTITARVLTGFSKRQKSEFILLPCVSRVRNWGLKALQWLSRHISGSTGWIRSGVDKSCCMWQGGLLQKQLDSGKCSGHVSLNWLLSHSTKRTPTSHLMWDMQTRSPDTTWDRWKYCSGSPKALWLSFNPQVSPTKSTPSRWWKCGCNKSDLSALRCPPGS